MKKAKILFSVLITICILTACSSDDDSSTSEPTVEELLTSGNWYVESQTDFSMDDCIKHSNFRFLANGNFISESYGDDSGTCEMNNTHSGTWEFLSDTEITMTYETSTITYTIVTISENELVFNWMSGGDSLTTILDKNPGNG